MLRWKCNLYVYLWLDSLAGNYSPTQFLTRLKAAMKVHLYDHAVLRKNFAGRIRVVLLRPSRDVDWHAWTWAVIAAIPLMVCIPFASMPTHVGAIKKSSNCRLLVRRRVSLGICRICLGFTDSFLKTRFTCQPGVAFGSSNYCLKTVRPSHFYQGSFLIFSIL